VIKWRSLQKAIKQEASGVYWSCDGSPEFELYEVDYNERGTKIVLHINEESKEFLEAGRIKGILERFCKFLPIPIYFSEAGRKRKRKRKSINNTDPLWIKKPSELKQRRLRKIL
jgi:molecular chaperone HtpG